MKKHKNILITSLLLSTLILSGCTKSEEVILMDLPTDQDSSSSIETKKETSKNTTSSNEEVLLEYLSQSNLVLDEFSWSEDKDSVITSSDESVKTGVKSCIGASDGIINYVTIDIYENVSESAVKEHLKPVESYYKTNGKISEELSKLYKDLTSEEHMNDCDTGKEQLKDNYLAVNKDITIKDKSFNIEILAAKANESLKENLSISIYYVNNNQ